MSRKTEHSDLALAKELGTLLEKHKYLRWTAREALNVYMHEFGPPPDACFERVQTLGDRGWTRGESSIGRDEFRDLEPHEKVGAILACFYILLSDQSTA